MPDHLLEAKELDTVRERCELRKFSTDKQADPMRFSPLTLKPVIHEENDRCQHKHDNLGGKQSGISMQTEEK